jgi:hypothetical protein
MNKCHGLFILQRSDVIQHMCALGDGAAIMLPRLDSNRGVCDLFDQII